MSEKLNAMIDDLQKLRTEAFGKDESLYKHLGAAIGRLIEASSAARELGL